MTIDIGRMPTPVKLELFTLRKAWDVDCVSYILGCTQHLPIERPGFVATAEGLTRKNPWPGLDSRSFASIISTQFR
jgi:hypothetical protein